MTTPRALTWCVIKTEPVCNSVRDSRPNVAVRLCDEQITVFNRDCLCFKLCAKHPLEPEIGAAKAPCILHQNSATANHWLTGA